MRTEELILSSLVTNETYCRKVISHIKEEYFHDKTDRILFSVIQNYFTQYNQSPDKTALLIEAEKNPLSAEQIKEVQDKVRSLTGNSEHLAYLTKTTEDFCKKQAIYNALMESIQIADGRDSKKNPEAIPSILQEALAVCFDPSVGHDYTEDSESRFEYYNRKELKIPFNVEYFNKITKKGVNRKTLNIIMAPPHGGKSLVMVNFGVGALYAGYNVLYVTMEMAEEEIAKRFDVNMMGVDFETLESLPKNVFNSKIDKVKEKALGKLVIKEFPTGSAHAGHIKILIEELRVKKSFVPDLIIVDYMNICASEKYRSGGSATSYTIVKSIGEELRALAIQTNTAIWTATQTNRSGVSNSDVDMTNVSESLGVAMIADSMFAIINSEELIKMNQLLIKQLKNRYRDLNLDNKFVIGIDRARMRIYDLEESAQRNISKDVGEVNHDDIPVFDVKARGKPGTGFDSIKF